MAGKVVKMWFDPEADFLEVTFEQKPGYFRATENDQVMERVDEEGNRDWILYFARQFPQEGSP